MNSVLKFALILMVSLLATNASAGMVDLESHEGLSGEAWANVTNDGLSAVTFELGLSSGTIADIRGFFFDIDGVIDDISVSALTDINNDFTTDNVITGWPNVSGSAGMQGAGTFDVGIEFGKPGIGNNKGDIRAVTFTVEGITSLDIGDNFGMRLQSFGADRQGSRKMLGSIHAPVPGAAILGFIGIATSAHVLRRRRNRA